MRKHKCQMEFTGRAVCNCGEDHGHVLVWSCIFCMRVISVDGEQWWETAIIARLERMLTP